MIDTADEASEEFAALSHTCGTLSEQTSIGTAYWFSNDNGASSTHCYYPPASSTAP